MCLYSTSQCLLCLLFLSIVLCCFFFFKQKTAYEMRISDWSSDVCSSDLIVDDRLLRIGSANLCNRSFGLDTECDAVLVPEDAGGRAGIADLRNALLAEHCGATAAQVADLLTEHAGSLFAVLDALASDGDRRLLPVSAGGPAEIGRAHV